MEDDRDSPAAAASPSGAEAAAAARVVIPHDVFVSYSSKDKSVADAVCHALESDEIRCWIAPRDVLPGSAWGSAIVDAIGTSRVMVLVYSSHANASRQVMREVERAVNKDVAIVPFRIEAAPMSKTLEYFISASHWLDAMTGEMEAHLAVLVRTIRALLEAGEDADGVLPAGRPRPRGKQWRHAKLAAFIAAGVAAPAVGALIVASQLKSIAAPPMPVRMAPAPQASPSATATATAKTPTTAPPGTFAVTQPAEATVADGLRKVYSRLQASQTSAGRKAAGKETAPPNPPVFRSISGDRAAMAASDTAGGAPFVVVIDYTDPDGRDSLRHTHLQLRGHDTRQTILYSEMNQPMQWWDETHLLDDVRASKSPIPNGYRVTYAFRLRPGWVADLNEVTLIAFCVDWNDANAPEVQYDWTAALPVATTLPAIRPTTSAMAEKGITK